MIIPLPFMEMDYRAAWRDFYDNFFPKISGSLTRNEAREIDTAERDYHEQRTDARSGKKLTLGPTRVQRLIERHAPGRYSVEHRIVFTLLGSA